MGRFANVYSSSLVALLSLAYVAWRDLHLTIAAVGIVALAVMLALLGLSRHRMQSGRVAQFVRGHAALALLAVPLTASMLIADVASRNPQRQSYTAWLLLWIAAVASVPFLAGARPRILPRAALRSHLPEIAFVVAVAAGAFAARAISLNSIPRPYSGDEAAFGLAAIDTIHGYIPNMFHSGLQGTPTMYFFFVAASDKLFGVGVVGGRAGSVLAGVLAVVVTYFFVRELFGRTAAMAGSVFLAFYHFHIHFSRQSMPNVLDALLIPLVLWFAFRAMRDGKPLDYALTGLTLGLTLYAWVSARLIPFEIAGLWGWYMLMRRRLLPNMPLGVAVTIVAIIIAAAPLGWWWYHHQNEFNTRLNIAGIYHTSAKAPSWIDEQRANGRSTFEIYRDQAQDTFDLTVRLHNPAGDGYHSPVPLVQRWTLIPFLVGLLLALIHIRQPRYFLLLIMFIGPLIAGGMLTIPPPSSQRVIGIIPALAAFVGIGAEGIATLVLRWRPKLVPTFAVALALFLSIFSLQLYFGRYVGGHYYVGGITEAAQRYGDEVKTVVPDGTHIYWYLTDVVNPDHPTLGFGLRNYPVTVLDSNDKELVTRNRNGLTPRDGQIAFVFAGARIDQAPRIEGRCPNGESHHFGKPSGAMGPELLVYLVDPGSCSIAQ